MTRVVIVIPWRDKGDAWRRRNLEIVLTYLTDIHVAPFVLADDGQPPDGPFNRSAAYNAGVAANPNADVYVFHEADMLIPALQLHQAIQMAGNRPGLVVPFTSYRYLAEQDTSLVHSGADAFNMQPEYEMTNGRSVGAVNVVSSESMEQIGQWDETFQGWGFDDRAMERAFKVATKRCTGYAPGPGVHLWHTPGWKSGGHFRGGTDVLGYEHAATEANRHRYHRYKLATTPQAIRNLTYGAYA